MGSSDVPVPWSRESPGSSDHRVMTFHLLDGDPWNGSAGRPGCRTSSPSAPPLNAVAFTFRTEIVMSEARNADVLERGLLIGGKSVSASSGKLADDISPWGGEIYARVAAGTPMDITRAADAAEAAFPSWSRVG